MEKEKEEKEKGKGKSQSNSKSSKVVPDGKGNGKSSTPGGKPSEGKSAGENEKRKPRQCVYYASSAGCIRGKSCPFLHQNDSVTKKPLSADAADVQRLKGKPQFVLKPINSGSPNPTAGVPVPSSRATSSTTPAPQVSMLRVDRQQLEPQPEPVRRHPIAEWRPHSGPTRERHPKFLLPTDEAVVPMCPHMAGQHSEHIVFGANQHACWLRCTLCEKTSRRVLYRYTICVKCPGRRHDDDEALWATATRCVSVKWNCLLLRLFWMRRKDTHRGITSTPTICRH